MRTSRPFDRPVAIVLAALGVALVASTLALQTPAGSSRHRTEETTALLATLSLIHDLDTRWDAADRERPLPSAARPDAGRPRILLAPAADGTAFATPWLFALLAAPAVAVLGPPGLSAVGMALLFAAIWLGTLHLRRWNADGLSAAVAAGVYLGSHAWVAALGAPPGSLILAAVAVGLHGGLPEAATTAGGHRWRRRLVASAAGIAVAAWHVPVLALLALPILVARLRDRRSRELAIWTTAALATAILLAAGSLLLTGSARAGGSRGAQAVAVERTPDDNADAVRSDAPVARGASPADPAAAEGNRAPDPSPDPRILAERLRDLVVGRRDGLLPNQPFALLCLVAFLVDAPRSRRRWTLLAAIGAALVLPLLPGDLAGGSDGAGPSSILVALAPAFLYLVRRVRPRALVAPTWAVAGATVGWLWWTAGGAAQPPLRTAVRRAFPLELSRPLPGLVQNSLRKIWIGAREDRVRFVGREIWIRGGGETELVLQSRFPLDSLGLEIASPVEGNVVELRLDGIRRRLRAGAEPLRVRLHPPEEAARRWERDPQDPTRVAPILVRRLGVTVTFGAETQSREDGSEPFFLGARLRILEKADPGDSGPPRKSERRRPGSDVSPEPPPED